MRSFYMLDCKTDCYVNIFVALLSFSKFDSISKLATTMTSHFLIFHQVSYATGSSAYALKMKQKHKTS
jgi:hypothetical protein